MVEETQTPPTGLKPRPLEDLVRPVAPIRETDRIGDAAHLIAKEGGGLPVVDSEGKLVGYLSERELIAAMFPPYLQDLRHTGFLTKDFASLIRRAAEAAEKVVGEYMMRDPEALHVEDSESHAAEVFLHQGIRTLPVVDDHNRVRGIVGIADVIQSLLMVCGRAPGSA